jgi:RNA chaperone Hfq
MSRHSRCPRKTVLLLLLLFFSASLGAQEAEPTSLPGVALQDRFIESLIDNEVPVVISLSNFAEVEGVVMAHDTSVLLLQNQTRQFRQRLIYKNAIVLIAPIPIAVEVLSEF